MNNCIERVHKYNTRNSPLERRTENKLLNETLFVDGFYRSPEGRAFRTAWMSAHCKDGEWLQ